MVGIYFSRTGNTKHCVEYFIRQWNENVVAYSIENQEAKEAIKKHKTIVFGYPIYYSNLPKIVRDFIVNNQELWSGKKVFIIATMGLFSGDGTGISARLLKKYGANVVGGVHLKMPDCISDVKLLKKNKEQNKEMIKKAEYKMKKTVKNMKENIVVKEGLGFGSQLMGLFGQRLYFMNKTADYTDKLKINEEQCVGCGKCVILCPMKNLKLQNGKIKASGTCTMCYRCINHCPQKAITLLGKKIYTQWQLVD